MSGNLQTKVSTLNQLAAASQIVHVEGPGQHLHSRFEVAASNDSILRVAGNEQHLESTVTLRTFVAHK